MTFDARQLQAFLAVADTGSLGRAAGAVHLSQPALSRMIGDMEARLQQLLFDRHSKGMKLTDAGELLLPNARLLLFEMDRTRAEMDALRGVTRDTVRVGAVATIARSILPGAIGKLLANYPSFRVELTEQTDSELFAALDRRDLDLVIAAENPDRGDIKMIGECRYDDVYATFCNISHALAQAEKVTLAEVLGQRWVMPAAGVTPRDLFELTIRKFGEYSADIAVETRSLDAMVSTVAATHLLGWLPGPLIASAQAAGAIALLNVAELALARRFFVYRRSKGALPTAALCLLEILPLIRSQWMKDTKK